jgi:hypothetical protein
MSQNEQALMWYTCQYASPTNYGKSSSLLPLIRRTRDLTPRDWCSGARFGIAEAFYELNTTDDDKGFQILDAEGWKRVRAR